jgi:SAM-dependent methyltransferase
VQSIRFSLGDAKRIPFDDHSFDLVLSHQLLHQLPDPVVALREINRVTKPGGGLLVRDVRRLPEPWMTLALPLWCLGYGRHLRAQTYASFRAGLTNREFQDLARDSGVERSRVRAYLLTHQGIERTAVPYEAFPVSTRSPWPFAVRMLKSAYVSNPLAK